MKKRDLGTMAAVAGTTLLSASAAGAAGCTGACGACSFTCALPVMGVACLAVGGQILIKKKSSGKGGEKK